MQKTKTEKMRVSLCDMLTEKEVLARVRISRHEITILESVGQFPKSLTVVSDGSTVWLKEEIDAFLEENPQIEKAWRPAGREK